MNFFTKMNKFPYYFEHPYREELSKENLEIILDFLGIFAHNKLENMNIDYPSMFTPFTVVIAKSRDNILGIGLTDDKTTASNKQLMSLIDRNYDVNQLKEKIIRTAHREFGVDIKWYATLNYSSILEKDTMVSKFGHIDDSIDRFNEFLNDSNYKEFLIALDFSSDELVQSIRIERENIMDINPIFKARELSVDQKMIFCALPFTEDRLEIFDDVIKPEIESEFGMSVIRSGNIFQPNLNIMESIWTYINQAKIVIVDLSDKNPNVFYELGICHTLGKQVITICDQESLEKDYNGKLPFDIGAINTIFYRNRGNGMSELKKALKANIQSVIEERPIIL